jgi:long-chain acyl-CoA synthetase
MNAFDYFFENTGTLGKNFVLGSRETISFADLYSRSNHLAAYLREKFGRGQNIILIAPNSVFMITAYLAIIKSDNVVIPLNPEIEQTNLDFIKNKCQAGVVITTSRLAKKLSILNATFIDENGVTEILAHEVSLLPYSKDTPSDQLAEIIFTSGSTGEPKGVMISHKNLVANTSSIIEYLKLTEQDIMLVVLPFYYCYGLSLLHTHLRVGGSIVLNNMFIMLGSVIDDMRKFKCTGFAGVPTHFQILLRKSDSFKTANLTYLRYVTQAGGKLHNAFISEFIDALPNIRFTVMYGQTEATARLSWLSPEKLPEKIGSCGKGIPGVDLKVQNEHGKPVKPGEIGEIVARGDNIMPGYYKDEESTRQTIIDGWLHTGDLATIDEDGYIFLKARKKEILKVGGRRVSPKEIEDVIVSMPEVIDCSIVGIGDDILGETMKATIVIKESCIGIITPDNIKKYCSERLASYKIPQIIELKSEILISATGKKIKI